MLAVSLGWTALKPVLRILTVMGVGVLLSRRSILNPSTAKAISSILLYVGYPSVIFASVLSSLSFDNVQNLFLIWISAIYQISIGLALGWFALWMTDPPIGFRNTCVMALAMGNWGDLTLTILVSLGKERLGGDINIGIAYVAGFLVISNLFFFSVGFTKIGQDVTALELEVKASAKEALIPCASNDITPTATTVKTLVPPEIDAKKDRGVVGKVVTFLQYLQALSNPNTVAVGVAFVLALTPLRYLFIDDPLTLQEPALKWALDIIKFLASFAMPLGLINLGGALGETTKSKGKVLNGNVLFFLAFTKLIVIPTIGICITEFFTRIIPIIPVEDKVLRFVILFQGCVPTASSTVFFTQHHSPSGRADLIASLLVAQYFVSIFTLTLWLGVILYLIS